jgi:phage protein D
MSSYAPIPLFDNAQPLYVPDFQLTLDGEVAKEPRRDVLSVTYRDSVNEVDSFELTVNNWDAERGKEKYDPPSAPEYEQVWGPGTEVVLELGYQGDLRTMTRGVITAVEGSWSEGGAPTLNVRGLNKLHDLRRIEHTFRWENVTDSAIATQLGGQPLSNSRPGLGMPVRTSPRNEQQHPFVSMHNQYDILFLLERARLNDYELVYHEADSTSDTEYLTFGPSESSTPVYRFEWGKSLASFRYSLDVSEQVGTLIVRSWDRGANGPFVGTADWTDVITDSDEQDRMLLVSPGFEERTHVEADQPVRTQAEANALALDLLRRRLKEMMTGSGSTVGLPDLRAGRKIEIVGFAERSPGLRVQQEQQAAKQPPGTEQPRNLVEGEYFVTETTHTLGANGYRTEFRARREGKARPQGSLG